MTPELRQAIVDGAYWLREPGPNCQVVVAYTGAVAPEAIQAIGLMAEDRRDVGSSPSPRPTGSTPAGPRRCARASAALSTPARTSSGCLPTYPAIAASFRCSMAIRRPLGWLGAVSATASGRSGSSTSARPARSPDSTGTTASTPTPSSLRRSPSRPAVRSGTCARWDDPSNASHDVKTVPVAIVGGGPVGLMLALFLDLYGVRSVIFNSEPEVRRHPKGSTHNSRTMEHHRRLGIATRSANSVCRSTARSTVAISRA